LEIRNTSEDEAKGSNMKKIIFTTMFLAMTTLALWPKPGHLEIVASETKIPRLAQIPKAVIDQYDGHYETLVKLLPSMDETQRIQIHLTLLEKRLRAKDVSSLSVEKQANRAHVLDLLRIYAERGQFPENFRFSFRTPEFIGDNGVVCAVGYLIEKTAGRNVVEKISRLENEAYVPDMKSLELLPWLQKWGIDLGEAAMIQPSYPYRPTGFSPANSITPSPQPTALQTATEQLQSVIPTEERERQYKADANIQAMTENTAVTFTGALSYFLNDAGGMNNKGIAKENYGYFAPDKPIEMSCGSYKRFLVDPMEQIPDKVIYATIIGTMHWRLAFPDVEIKSIEPLEDKQNKLPKLSFCLDGNDANKLVIIFRNETPEKEREKLLLEISPYFLSEGYNNPAYIVWLEKGDAENIIQKYKDNPELQDVMTVRLRPGPWQ
jgi:hypothetical protein